MLSITTEDGEHFTIIIDGSEHQVHRNDLVPFVDHAQHLLEVTREQITSPLEPDVHN